MTFTFASYLLQLERDGKYVINSRKAMICIASIANIYFHTSELISLLCFVHSLKG